MKATFAPVLVVGLAAGLGGGWLAAAFVDDSAAAAATDVSSVQLERLGRQLAALGDETTKLVGRVRDLELRGAAVAAAPERELLDASESPRMQLDDQQLAALTAAVSASGGDVGAEFEGRVAAALDRIRDAEDAERDERRQEARVAALDEYVKQLTEQLALDSYQAGRMKQSMTAQNEKRDELFTAARENGTWATMREGMGELRDATRKDLETYLTPGQLESYDALGGQDFGGGRFGRGGFGPGGPGGGRGGPPGGDNN